MPPVFDTPVAATRSPGSPPTRLALKLMSRQIGLRELAFGACLLGFLPSPVQAGSVSAVAVAAEPVASCAHLVAGQLLDCEEEREVTLELLLVAESDAEDCRSGRADCGQTFIARCDDYWSQQHLSSHAIVLHDAAGVEDRLAREDLGSAGAILTVRLRRDLDCDETPYDGAFGTECEAWECFPACCRELSPFESIEDGGEIPLDELRPLGSLPCFRLLPEPSSGSRAPHRGSSPDDSRFEDRAPPA